MYSACFSYPLPLAQILFQLFLFSANLILHFERIYPKKLEIQLFKPFVARHCKKHEQISVPWKLICQYKNEKDLAQQFANRETEAQKRL